MFLMRKLVVTFALLSLLATSAFAGKEDWEGNFTLEDGDGRSYNSSHSPTRINFVFISSRSFTFSKGVRMNGLVSSAAGVLSFDSNVENFKLELAKWGTITGEDIRLGPTYL